MGQHRAVLEKSPLFAGISGPDLGDLLACLPAAVKTLGKDEVIATPGDSMDVMGLVLSGRVSVHQEDFWGHRSIVSHIEPGDIFCEAFACAGAEVVSFSVVAAARSEVMLLDCRKIVTQCDAACRFHAEMIRNLIGILALKNIQLTRKIEHLAQRSTRSKLLSYFSESAARSRSNTFSIPFNRQDTCRLPVSGPVRPVQRAYENAQRRPAGVSQKPIYPIERIAERIV